MLRPEIHEGGDDGKDDGKDDAVSAGRPTSHPRRLVRGRWAGVDGGNDTDGLVGGVEEAPGHHIPS